MKHAENGQVKEKSRRVHAPLVQVHLQHMKVANEDIAGNIHSRAPQHSHD